MVKTYQASGFARTGFRAALNELVMTGEIAGYTESRGILTAYFAVNASEEIHRRFNRAIQIYNS